MIWNVLKLTGFLINRAAFVCAIACFAFDFVAAALEPFIHRLILPEQNPGSTFPSFGIFFLIFYGLTKSFSARPELSAIVSKRLRIGSAGIAAVTILALMIWSLLSTYLSVPESDEWMTFLGAVGIPSFLLAFGMELARPASSRASDRDVAQSFRLSD